MEDNSKTLFSSSKKSSEIARGEGRVNRTARVITTQFCYMFLLFTTGVDHSACNLHLVWEREEGYSG